MHMPKQEYVWETGTHRVYSGKEGVRTSKLCTRSTRAFASPNMKQRKSSSSLTPLSSCSISVSCARAQQCPALETIRCCDGAQKGCKGD